MDAVSSLRKLLEEIIAPSVRSLEEKVEQAGERARDLAGDIKEIRHEHRELLKLLNSELSSLKERVGRVEGRADGLKSELTAVLEAELVKAAQRYQARTTVERELLPGPTSTS